MEGPQGKNYNPIMSINYWTWHLSRKKDIFERKIVIIFLSTRYGYSKEPSQWDSSVVRPKQMYKLMDKIYIFYSQYIF